MSNNNFRPSVHPSTIPPFDRFSTDKLNFFSPKVSKEISMIKDEKDPELKLESLLEDAISLMNKLKIENALNKYSICMKKVKKHKSNIVPY